MLPYIFSLIIFVLYIVLLIKYYKKKKDIKYLEVIVDEYNWRKKTIIEHEAKIKEIKELKRLLTRPLFSILIKPLIEDDKLNGFKAENNHSKNPYNTLPQPLTAKTKQECMFRLMEFITNKYTTEITEAVGILEIKRPE